MCTCQAKEPSQKEEKSDVVRTDLLGSDNVLNLAIFLWWRPTGSHVVEIESLFRNFYFHFTWPFQYCYYQLSIWKTVTVTVTVSPILTKKLKSRTDWSRKETWERKKHALIHLSNRAIYNENACTLFPPDCSVNAE